MSHRNVEPLGQLRQRRTLLRGQENRRRCFDRLAFGPCHRRVLSGPTVIQRWLILPLLWPGGNYNRGRLPDEASPAPQPAFSRLMQTAAGPTLFPTLTRRERGS